ncbi:ankyrin repeat domain protein [Leptospira ryugenii]|uniref:Ankyrin repeat domain protein n=1 Tax=Leptospira ryugenii TaxID=1917863 RepID=A0A2P2E0L1_9LEPT|nr:ankyrin repeat domain-containing protein [Leptospira ryugenii]GBF50430.1 ankyrin repeat domain protein [Leptospira ryugenii]
MKPRIFGVLFASLITFPLFAEGGLGTVCAVENLPCIKERIKRAEVVDLYQTNSLGRNSLHYAVERGEDELVSYILNNQSADVIGKTDLYGNSPLHLAVIHQRKEILDLFLQYNPDLNLVDRHGETALDLAFASGNEEIKNLLSNKGASSQTGGKSKITIYIYIVYILLSLAITIWVARTLSKNGRFFLVDAFHNEELADSVNHLLVVGFYLVNLGYITLALKIGMKPNDAVESLEILSNKIGFVILILGAMHFFNLYLLGRLRKRTLQKRELAQQN